MKTQQQFWSPEYLADHLGIPLRTVYAWRYRGEGPRAYKIGRHVRYRPEDIEAWLEGRTGVKEGGHA